MAAPVISMPSRGDRSAPRFDTKHPRELRRYFSDLEYCFERAQIVDDQEKKSHACRFVDVDTSELWESLAEFADNTKTYTDFRQIIYSLYPGSEEECKWSVADMDKLVGERSRLGVLSLGDLGEYHRQFLAITTFLIGKTRLSTAEQSRAFARGFQAELWMRISQRLQLKLPDHFPDDPYTLDAIFEAAQYVLHGTNSTLLVTSTNSTTLTAGQANAVKAEIKTEDLAAILEHLTETFVKALSTQQNNRATTSDRPPRPSPGGGGNCNFCGSPEHFIRNCMEVLEYIKDGKCKRNTEGKVILPSGAYVPRDITGQWLRDRIDEWHRRNPNQLAAAQMMYRVLANGISSTAEPEPLRPILATRQTHPHLFDNSTVPSLQLTAQERIDSLERELYQLRRRGQGPQTRARAQEVPSNNQAADRDEDVTVEEATAQQKRVMRPEVVIPKKKPSAVEEVAPTEPEPPIHPFAEARDATYAAPQTRNFGTAPKPPAMKKAEPAYRTQAPVYDGKIAADVYDRAMSTSVMLTQRELLSLSPEVRSQVREATSAKRSAPKEPVKEIHTLAEDDNLPSALDDLATENNYPNSIFTNAIHQPATPPPGSLIIPDPYETYLKSLPNGATPETLVVAKESLALRSIYPLVDNQQHVESIIDPGSQIIAMSEDVCMDLALIYDPSIILNMQSANGEVDKSLGLARNVPMRIGDITLYVQIHIIRSPAYDILLGRPFDILTESVVRNFANEDQTITIFDPNSGSRATVPTTPRGRPRRLVQRPGFLNSMI